MPRPDLTPQFPEMGAESDEALVRALASIFRPALQESPQLAPAPDFLADRLARAVTVRLAEAVVEAGGTAAGFARSLLPETPASGMEDQSPEARVLEALRRHPAGREPGLAPEALSTLTRVPGAVLGPLVSAMVQAGNLVREAWLVRLPRAEDLLPSRRASDGAADGERERRDAADQAGFPDERRSAGDRRAVGDRRMFDRRTL
jgi:hypothetical protein